MTISEGANAVFVCDSNTVPLWYFDGGTLPENAHRINRTTLYITTADHENTGYYECRGTDNMGYLLHSRGHLIVMGKFYEELNSRLYYIVIQGTLCMGSIFISDQSSVILFLFL